MLYVQVELPVFALSPCSLLCVCVHSYRWLLYERLPLWFVFLFIDLLFSSFSRLHCFSLLLGSSSLLLHLIQLYAPPVFSPVYLLSLLFSSSFSSFLPSMMNLRKNRPMLVETRFRGLYLEQLRRSFKHNRRLNVFVERRKIFLGREKTFRDFNRRSKDIRKT